ncbi:MAG: tetratricopeptide repeat protein [Nitrososphaeraceae archaeon]
MDRPFLTIIDEIAEEDEVIRQDIRNAESNPSDPNSWAKLADRLLQKGYYEQSLVCYKKALELEPNNISSWYNRGLALSSIGKYDEAIFCFDEAIKINPNIVYAWNSKGYAFNSQGKFREAIKAYDRVLEIDPNNISAWYNRGLALNNMGSFDEAIQSYDKVLEIDEKNTDALNAKGLALERSGKGDDAVQYYDRVTQVYNDRIEENNKNGYFLLESGKFREAIKAYDRVLEIDPNNTNAWYNKGRALHNIGKYNEAIQSYDKVLEIASQKTKYIEVLNNKGLAFEKLGRFDEAVQSYDKALEIDEKNIDALYNKSNTYHVLGKYQEAEGKSDQALKSYMEAVGRLNKIVGLESNNVRALELLRELYSNYVFEYNNALTVDAKLLAIESTPLRKSKFAEDMIKVGKNKKGRQLAFEAKREIPSEQIKRQSCVRLLILSSFFLEGNSIKGNEELVDFLRFYEVLENFKVEEKEWNFNGLIKAINSHSSNSTSKQILTNIIDLLRGKGNREKILSKLLSNVSDSGVQIGHRAYAKIKIIVPIALAAILVTGMLSFYFVEVVNAESCGITDTTLLSKKMGVPTSIVVNDNTNVVYVAYSNQKAISAIDCHNREIVEQISTPGIVTDLSVDKKTNTLYADTKDVNGTMAMAIDGGTFGVDGMFEKLVNKYIRKVIPLPEYKDNNNILKVNNGNTQDAFDFDGNKEHTYLLGDNQNTIYVVGDNNTAYPITSELTSGQDVNLSKSHDIAFNPDKNIVYLANNYKNGTGSISVIDAANHSLLKTITGPFRSIDSIAFDSKSNKIYITDPFRHTVSVINGSNNKIVKNIPVGAAPRDMFIDTNGMIYVANLRSNAVSVINSTLDEVVKIIHLPEASGVLSSVSADPKTKMVYVGLTRDGRSGLIQMINSTNPRWSDYIQVGPTLSDVVFNSNTSKIYLAKTQDGSISVVDSTNNQTIKVIPLEGELPFKMVVNPKTNMIYVVNNDSNTISVIDGKENNLLKNEKLPFNVLDIAVNPKLNKIYAIGENNKNLSIIDGINNEVVKNETLSFFPSAIEVNPETNRLYIANYNNWSLTSIDSSNDNVTNGKIVNLNIPPQSITVEPITNKIYVSSYVREDITPGETNVKPISVAFPHRTQVQIIDGNNDEVMFNNKPLKLDPKYGAVILAANPNNGDILAVPLSTDTILSWNMEQAKRAMYDTGGNLLNYKEVRAGTDPAQVAFNVQNGKKDMIYIINYRLNAILEDELKKYEIQTNNE